MNPNPLQAGADNQPRPPLPAWAVPGALMANLGVRRSTVVLPLTTATRLCVADPKRVTLCILTALGAATGVSAAPGGNPTVGAFQIDGTPIGSTFDLLTFGPIVNQEWTGYSTAGATVVVVEVYQLS